MIKKPSIIKWADPRVKKAYCELKSMKDMALLYKSISRALDNIEKNAFSGLQIPKKLIPKIYLQKYKIDNLWKYDLPKGWRLLYSVAHGEIKVISIIIEWMDHKNYERKFRY